jgi:hypothetical protein
MCTKFCKDCTHYSPRHFVATDEGIIGWSPAWCDKKVGEPDPISGVFARAGDPATCRADETMCGKDGKWFEPGTLDGRLAMLDAKPVEEKIEVEHSGN